MEEQLSLTDINGPDSEVAEEMVFFPMDTVDGKWVTAGGKLITPACANPLSDARRILIVQHGLPGDKWRMRVEDKARRLAKETEDTSTLVLMPGGLRSGVYEMGISSEGGGSDMAACYIQRPFFFDQPFSFQRYVRALFAAMKAVRRYAKQLESIHIAGHSYGALAVFYALRQCEKTGIPMPDSANFLSPFVQVALDTQDPDIALNVINTSVAVDENLVTSGPRSHIGALRNVLSDLQRFYHLTEPNRSPVDWHMQTFGARFFQNIGNLAYVGQKDCRVRAFRGDKDPHINEGHSDLIARRIGTTRDAIETVLPEDGHNLESLDLRALVEA